MRGPRHNRADGLPQRTHARELLRGVEAVTPRPEQLLSEAAWEDIRVTAETIGGLGAYTELVADGFDDTIELTGDGISDALASIAFVGIVSPARLKRWLSEPAQSDTLDESIMALEQERFERRYHRSPADSQPVAIADLWSTQLNALQQKRANGSRSVDRSRDIVRLLKVKPWAASELALTPDEIQSLQDEVYSPPDYIRQYEAGWDFALCCLGQAIAEPRPGIVAEHIALLTSGDSYLQCGELAMTLIAHPEARAAIRGNQAIIDEATRQATEQESVGAVLLLSVLQAHAIRTGPGVGVALDFGVESAVPPVPEQAVY